MRSVAAFIGLWFLLGGWLGACSTRPGVIADPILNIRSCLHLGFEEHEEEHEILVSSKVFRTRILEGEARSYWGDWPPEASLTIELRSYRTGNRILLRPVGSEGRFFLPTVARGEYCFKLMAPGWKSVIGVVVVDPSSDTTEAFIVLMPLGT